jgi:hypothetical protein
MATINECRYRWLRVPDSNLLKAQNWSSRDERESRSNARSSAQFGRMTFAFERQKTRPVAAGLCVNFYPAHEGQECPDVIDAGDEGGDWQ